MLPRPRAVVGGPDGPVGLYRADICRSRQRSPRPRARVEPRAVAEYVHGQPDLDGKESVHAREEVGPTEREETQACELWVVRLLVIGFKVREEVQVCFKGGIILVLVQHV